MPLELSPELFPSFLIIGLSIAFLGTMSTLWIVANEEAKRRAAEMYAERPPATIDIATETAIRGSPGTSSLISCARLPTTASLVKGGHALDALGTSVIPPENCRCCTAANV